MRTRRWQVALGTLAVAAALAVGLTSLAFAGNGGGNGNGNGAGGMYEITVTNLTRGQIFSPAVVATHTGDMEPIFMPGTTASMELAQVAEDAMLDPLMMQVGDDSSVGDVQTLAGPIMPGESATVTVDGSGGHHYLSLVGMLVTTNDAFYGLNAAMLRGEDHVMLYSPAYDSGTEANNEDCMYIPGPPCGNPGVRMTEGAEGYVHIHAGIHGVADLSPEDYDWRNPVARITIQKAANS